MCANAQRDGRPLVRMLPLSECYKNQRTDGDVNRHCRSISQSECTTSDLMLFQIPVPAELCWLNKNGTNFLLINNRQFCIICHFKVCPAPVLHSSKTHQHTSRRTQKNLLLAASELPGHSRGTDLYSRGTCDGWPTLGAATGGKGN